jgi:ribosomal protein S18 acetylase RimI-like enzyme
MAHPITIQARRAGDAREVRRVARAAWRATYADLVPKGFIRAILRAGYHRERLLLGLLDPGRDAFVARRDGRVVGYADAVERGGGHVELTRIYVAPTHQGEGAGHALLEAVLAAMRTRGATRLEVHVEPSNVAALAWYARQGFSETGRDTFVVGPWTRPTVVLARGLDG